MAKTKPAPKRTNTAKQSTAPKLFVGLLLLIAAVGLGLMGISERNEPSALFEAMVENNFRTTSVTRSVQQGTEEQSVDQTLQSLVGQQHVVKAHTVLKQNGLGGSTIIHTESLGTPTTDYVQYSSIDTDQKNTEGKDLDFSGILNTWGKSATSSETNGELYSEAVLGVVPLGNLSQSSRKRLMQVVREKEVYKVDFDTVRKTSLNGRPTYVYDVKVMPEAYIVLLKQFGREVGLTQLERLDPATYKDSTPLEFQVSVDVLTRRLSKITFTNGRQEYYGSYGLKSTATLPVKTISIEELQTRIQSVQ